MFFGEYSYEEDIAAQREEAKEEGMQKQAEETAIKMLKDNLPTDKTAQYSGLPLEKVMELQESLEQKI